MAVSPAVEETVSPQRPLTAAVAKKATIVEEWSPPPAAVAAAGRPGGGFNHRTTRARSRASRQRSNILRSMELNNEDEDNDGEPLTTELIAVGLDRIALVGYQASLNFTRLILPRCNIRDISVITQFPYLQELDLSFNKIEDLTPLREMRYLTVLNFENNHIRQIQFLTLSPSLTSFRRLNFADNSIANLPQFAGYLSLLSLNMHNNELVNLDGLASTRYLRYLDVSDNHVRSLDELCSAEHLAYLDVSGNRVKKFGPNIKHMKQLKTLKIAHNKLDDLVGLDELNNLQFFDASYNRIQQLESLLHLQTVRFLTHLDLSGNPVSRREAFVPMVYYLCNNLERLNGKPCTDSEWRLAREMFLVNPLIRGVRDHFRDVAMKVASFQFNGTQQHVMNQDAGGESSAAAIDVEHHKTFTIIFLMGPPGGGRETLAYRLSTQCPHLVRLVRTVTTRIESVATLPEILLPRNDYVYEQISESSFRSLIRNNELLLSYGRRGCLYGIRESDVDEAARQNLAVVACIDTTGVTDLIGSNVRPTTFYIYPFTPSIMRARVEECGYDDVNTKRVLSSLHYSETLREKFPDFFHGKIDSDDVDNAYETLLKKLEEVSGLRIGDPPGGWKWSSNSKLAAAAAAAAAALIKEQQANESSQAISNAQQQQQTPPSSPQKSSISDDRKRLGRHTMASIVNMPQTRSDFLFLDKDLQKTQDLSSLVPAMLPHHLRDSFLFGEEENEERSSNVNTPRVNFAASSHHQQNSDNSSSELSSSDEHFGQLYFKQTTINKPENGTGNVADKLKNSQVLTDPAEFEASWERRMEKSMMDEIRNCDSKIDVDFDEDSRNFAELNGVNRQGSAKKSKNSSKKRGESSAADEAVVPKPEFAAPQMPAISVPTVTTDDTPYTQPIDMCTAITAQPDLIFDASTADAALFPAQCQPQQSKHDSSTPLTKSTSRDKNEIIPIGRDISLQMLPRHARRQLTRIDKEIRQAVQRDVNLRRESPTFETLALQQLPTLHLQQPVLLDDSDDDVRQQHQVRQKMMSKMRLYNAPSQADEEDFFACPLHPNCNSPHHGHKTDQKPPNADDAYRKFDTYRQRITNWRQEISATQRQQKRVHDQKRQKQEEDSVKPSPVALAAMMGRGKKKSDNNSDNNDQEPELEIAYLDGIEIAGALPRKKQDVFSIERQQQFLAKQTNFPPLACRDLTCTHPGTLLEYPQQPKKQPLKHQRFESEENISAPTNTIV